MPEVDLAEAAARLWAGELVGIPTETVYGLAARALDADAVREVYRRKGRPTDHPLILHVEADPEPWAVVGPSARLLMERFWPGPLSLVLPRRPALPAVVAGGHPTVAVRCPAHPLTRALLAQVGPLAAPSANRFGGVSPTTAAHVRADFPDLAVLDGGPCAVGVESTILDLSAGVPSLLRPGSVGREELEALLGPVRLGGDTPASGTLEAHYAPRAEVVPTHAPDEVAAAARAAGRRVAVIPARAPIAYAEALYRELRAADALGVDLIVAPWADEEGVGAAVNDRLRRAGAARPGGLGRPHGTS